MSTTLRYVSTDTTSVASVDRMRLFSTADRTGEPAADLAPGTRQGDGSWLFTLNVDLPDGTYYLSTTVGYSDGVTVEDTNDTLVLPLPDFDLTLLKQLTGGGLGRTDEQLRTDLAAHVVPRRDLLTGSVTNSPDVYATAADLWDAEGFRLQAVEQTAGVAGQTVKNGDVQVTNAAAGGASAVAFRTASRLRRQAVKPGGGSSRVALDRGPRLGAYADRTFVEQGVNRNWHDVSCTCSACLSRVSTAY